MKIELKRFEGSLPHASELFGVYQPLLGWRSKITTDRFARDEEGVYRNATLRVLGRFRADLQVQLATDGRYKVDPLEIVDGVRTRY